MNLDDLLEEFKDEPQTNNNDPWGSPTLPIKK